MLRVTRKNSKRKNAGKRGGASLKEKWLSSVWQSKEHQKNRLYHYISEGNLEKVKIYTNRILNWSGNSKNKPVYTLFDALMMACHANLIEDPTKSPDIIYYFLNVPEIMRIAFSAFDKTIFQGNSNHVISPVDFAIDTGNLTMLDKLFDYKLWKYYKAVLVEEHLRKICELGNLDMYRKVSKIPISAGRWVGLAVASHWSQEKFQPRTKAVLSYHKRVALDNGHVELANLIQSMIDGGAAEPEPVLPHIEPERVIYLPTVEKKKKERQSGNPGLY